MLKNLTLVLLISSVTYACKSDLKSESKSELINVQIDTTMLFGVWGIHKGGDAAFRITKQDFYVVDFFETSQYSLEGNKLIVHSSEHYREGTIFEVSQDTLKIKWKLSDDVLSYWRFKD